MMAFNTWGDAWNTLTSVAAAPFTAGQSLGAIGSGSSNPVDYAINTPLAFYDDQEKIKRDKLADLNKSTPMDMKSEVDKFIAEKTGSSIPSAGIDGEKKVDNQDEDIFSMIEKNMKMPLAERMAQFQSIADATIAASRGTQEGLTSRAEQSRMVGGSDYLRKAAQLNSDIAAKAKANQLTAANNEQSKWMSLWQTASTQKLNQANWGKTFAYQQKRDAINDAFTAGKIDAAEKDRQLSAITQLAGGGLALLGNYLGKKDTSIPISTTPGPYSGDMSWENQNKPAGGADLLKPTDTSGLNTFGGAKLPGYDLPTGTPDPFVPEEQKKDDTNYYTDFGVA